MTNPTLYAAKAFKFNTANPDRGVQGIIDVPAGVSNLLSAEEAAHPFVQAHVSVPPGASAEGDGGAAEGQLSALRERVAALIVERDTYAAQVREQAEEMDGMRVALGQSPDERVAAAEAKAAAEGQKLAVATGEISQLRAALGQAKQQLAAATKKK